MIDKIKNKMATWHIVPLAIVVAIMFIIAVHIAMIPIGLLMLILWTTIGKILFAILFVGWFTYLGIDWIRGNK